MSGFTAVPRWNRNPPLVPGVGEHEVSIPDDLVAALRRLANESAVPLSSVLLTAHAGSYTRETRREMEMEAVQLLLKWFDRHSMARVI